MVDLLVPELDLSSPVPKIYWLFLLFTTGAEAFLEDKKGCGPCVHSQSLPSPGGVGSTQAEHLLLDSDFFIFILLSHSFFFFFKFSQMF
jgi:hypothetical protein